MAAAKPPVPPSRQTARNGDLWQQCGLARVGAGAIEFEEPRAPTVLRAMANSASVALEVNGQR